MDYRSNLDTMMKGRGFTLIEMLVSLGIFSVVVLISISALLTLTRGSEKANAILTAINNLDFAVENISRNIRVGEKFYCATGIHPVTDRTRDCRWGSGETSLSFFDARERRILYTFNKAKGSLDFEVLADPHSTNVRRRFAITAPEVIIEEMNINVTGSASNDFLQPRVLVRIAGRTNIDGLKEDEQISFDLQTTVSSRNPDF